MKTNAQSTLFGCALLLAAFHSIAREEPGLGKQDEVLKQVVEIARQNALNASKVDWEATERAATEILKKDPGDSGLTVAIRSVLKALGDHHSLYQPPSLAGTGSAAAAQSARNPTKKDGPIAVGGKRPNGVPLVAVNSWSGLTREAASEAAAEARDVLNASLDKRTCGLILDLSANSGGNMWPMVMGVLPLLSEGKLGQFEDREGKRTAVELVSHQLLYGGAPHFLNVPRLPTPEHLPSYVAMIVGPATASSGEITAILFNGQHNVRLFGRPTAGFTTANRVFKLENGGVLALTISTVSDREGKVYLDRLLPDDWLKERCK